MRRFFFILLTISILNAMEKEKDKEPEESPETARISTLTVEELMQQAIVSYEAAKSLYKQALAEKKQPETFENSKYHLAERFCYEANRFYAAAANKGYAGASTLAHDIKMQIHELEKIKLELSPEFYGISLGFTKSLGRTERAFTQSGDAKELITWSDLLKETNIDNIKKDLAKKAAENENEKEELAKKAIEKEATEKALQEASIEKIKEQFKKTDSPERDKKKTLFKEKKSDEKEKVELKKAKEAAEKKNKKASGDDKK
jgi:hypothetical protein